MISNTELENIKEVLTIPEGTLEDCFNQFSKYFNQDQFRACAVLVNFMNSNVLPQTHRIIAIYLIIESFKQENIKINPFSLNLIEIFERSECQYEKKLIYNSLVKANKDVGKISLKNLSNEIELTENFKTPDDFQSFKKYIQENLPHVYKIPGLKGVEIKSIIPDFGLNENNRYVPPSYLIPMEKIDISEVSLSGFQPDFIRPIPSPLDIGDDEPIWLNPGVVTDFAWDFNMNLDNRQMSEIMEIWAKASKTQLSESETKLLQEQFEKDPKLVQKVQMQPDILPHLVEKNPGIASIVIIKLLKSNQLSQYLEKLVYMDLSLNSLEVVNKVINSAELPKEFLTLYITNCISQCENQTKDKMVQTRLVRLVCVFIKSLIKSKIINPRDMYIELQAFCIEFSKINEASSLFKMLKTLDSNGNNQGSN